MSLNDGRVSSSNNEEIQKECIDKCLNNPDKDSCYKTCVKYYDFNKCVHFRTSRGYEMISGNRYLCADMLLFGPSADKFGELPKD